MITKIVNSRIIFGGSTMLLASMVLFLGAFLRIQEKFEYPWAVVAEISDCRPLTQRVPKGVFRTLYNEDCLKVTNSKSYIANFELDLVSESIPVRAVLSKGNEPVERVVVHIVGGPGRAVMNHSGIEIWTDRSRNFVEKCNAAILTPVYSGTFHRSEYPNSSENLATEEISSLIEKLQDSGVKVHLFGGSLGARLLAHPEVPIPEGQHLLSVPFLKTPRQLSEGYDKGTRADRGRNKSRSQSYYLGPADSRIIESVNIVRFIRAFFSNVDGAYDKNFETLWAEKEKIDPSARIRALIAENDARAGGSEFAAVLEGLGFAVTIAPGAHEAEGNEQTNERSEFGSQFLDDICDS